MATASDIIGRALRLLDVIASGEAVDAAIAADSLSVLNAMLAEWHEAGIGLPDYSLSGLSDTLATDAADSEAIAYQLAIRVAPEYGLSVRPELAAMARQTMFRLRSRYFHAGRPVPAAYY